MTWPIVLAYDVHSQRLDLGYLFGESLLINYVRIENESVGYGGEMRRVEYICVDGGCMDHVQGNEDIRLD